MSPLQLGAAVGVIVAAAVWSTAVGLRRAPRSLAAARHRMYGSAFADPGALVGHGPTGWSGRARWRAAVEDSAASRWVAGRFGAGLVVADLTPADVVTRVVAAAGLLLFSTLAGVVTLTAGGLLPPSPLWLVFALAIAAMGGWVMLSDVQSRIVRRLRGLRQAANDFVQLVAVGLTTDQSVEEAVRFALDVGTGEAFDLIRERVLTAPQRGVPVWEAIDDLGRVYEVRELSDFASSVERQGLQGVAIGDTVATLAASMRAKALDQLERDADKANANLSGPTIGFVVTTIIFLAYPLAMRIGEAFGG